MLLLAIYSSIANICTYKKINGHKIVFHVILGKTRSTYFCNMNETEAM